MLGFDCDLNPYLLPTVATYSNPVLTSCSPFHYAISVMHSVIQRVMLISTSPLPQISIYFALKPPTHPPSYVQFLPVGRYNGSWMCRLPLTKGKLTNPTTPFHALSGYFPSSSSLSAYIPTGSMRPQLADMSQLHSPWGELSRLW